MIIPSPTEPRVSMIGPTSPEETLEPALHSAFSRSSADRTGGLHSYRARVSERSTVTERGPDENRLTSTITGNETRAPYSVAA